MTRNRRTKKDHAGLLALVLLVTVFGGIAFLITSPASPHSGSPVQPLRTASESSRPEILPQVKDAFYGSIVNIPFTGPTTGTVKADTNCKPVENGLTNCVAIIMGADGRELDFSYSHDMSKQPCLAAGDPVTITLLSDGAVEIVRG